MSKSNVKSLISGVTLSDPLLRELHEKVARENLWSELELRLEKSQPVAAYRGPVRWRTAPPVDPVASKLDPDIAKRRAFIRRWQDLLPTAFCAKMEAAGYRTSERWQKWGCPKSYPAALVHRNPEIRKNFLQAMKNEIQNAKRPSVIKAWKERKDSNHPV